MEYYNYIVLAFIVAGAIIMALSAFLTRRIFGMLPNEDFRSSWRNLYLFMIFFFFGYLGAAYIVITGNRSLLEFLTGIIFFLGAFFVYIVVRIGFTTLKALKGANQGLEDRVKIRTKELELKNQELEHFAYIISHDLKSPLRGIENLAHFMEEDLRDGKTDEVFTNLSSLKGRVDRMEGLIQGIMDYSKIGMVKSEEEEIDMNLLVNSVFGLLGTKAVELKINTPLPTIRGIRVQFVQLFSNLISNGIKFNDKEQGTVIVDYAEKNNSHEFSVEDNGPGIPEKYHEKIFVVFQTLQARDTYESTGIGLSIVKKIVDLLNGSIKLESTNGKGTKFIISLPKNR
ncbi:signal transduction histidine kinase [Saonia flava]|uniref:histidine kinase n=1 Tax=Saonia flava TaxID=523696 RepID=A0A846QPN8_9FLAO|nr:ATP-binding protein [Saonia flava]NJB70031.1 signal transduction histidine kinase [Saonia flava]